MTCSSTLMRRASPIRRADAFVVQGGTKTTAIRRLLETRPDLLMRYEAILFLDDDVEIGREGIEALFATLRARKARSRQPSLTADSDSAWPFLKQPNAGDKILRASTVEIMAPLFTARALDRAGWAFSESVSGWGTDLLLGPAVRGAFGPESVGVIGSVAVRHARPSRHRPAGAFYRVCADMGSIRPTKRTVSSPTSASTAISTCSRQGRQRSLCPR